MFQESVISRGDNELLVSNYGCHKDFLLSGLVF